MALAALEAFPEAEVAQKAEEMELSAGYVQIVGGTAVCCSHALVFRLGLVRRQERYFGQAKCAYVSAAALQATGCGIYYSDSSCI